MLMRLYTFTSFLSQQVMLVVTPVRRCRPLKVQVHNLAHVIVAVDVDQVLESFCLLCFMWSDSRVVTTRIRRLAAMDWDSLLADESDHCSSSSLSGSGPSGFAHTDSEQLYCRDFDSLVAYASRHRYSMDSRPRRGRLSLAVLSGCWSVQTSCHRHPRTARRTCCSNHVLTLLGPSRQERRARC